MSATYSGLAESPPPDARVPVLPRAARLGWGALLGGLAVFLGVWLLLGLLGFAVQLSAVDPSDATESLGSVAVAAGVWTVAVWVLAVFAGATATAYLAALSDRKSALSHGLVLWSLATLLAVTVTAFTTRTIARGLFMQEEQTLAAGSTTGPSGAFELDFDSVLVPLNDRLRAEGKPTVTTEQVQAALRDASAAAAGIGHLDRGMLAEALANRAPLSDADAEQLASDIEAWFQARAQLAEEVRHTVLTIVDGTGKALFWVFGGLVLGLGAASVGAILGTARRPRPRAEPQPSSPPETAPEPQPPVSTPEHAPT